MQPPLKLHWAHGKPNFGDWLSPKICGALSGREIIHAPPNRCELVAIGSILGRLRHGWFARPTLVWGAGFIEERPALRSKHRYCAVRGHRTAELLKGVTVDALGDPGLLADLLVPDHASIPKRHRVAVVGHYKDRDHAMVRAFVAATPGAVALDIFTDPLELLRQLAASELVLSSSLHGLIAADALGVPNGWIEVSRTLRGGRFKFEDYYSVFGLKPVPNELAEVTAQTLADLLKGYERPGLARVKRDLRSAFPFPPTPR